MMTISKAAVPNKTLQVLNVVVSTPEARGGAIRAGLLLGEHLSNYVEVDTVKMAGNHDSELASELNLEEEFSPLPSYTILRDIGNRIIGSSQNYSNTVIWTKMSPPRPLREYDIVHLHNAVPLWGFLTVALQCKRLNIPYVITTHGISKIPELPKNMGMTRTQKKVFEYALFKPYKYALRHAKHLFALSTRDRNRLGEFFPNQTVSVVPNGVRPNPPEEYAAKYIEKELDIKPSTDVLLFVGKIMESKGIGDLLSAYKEIERDCTLIIAGPLEDQQYVDRMSELEMRQIQYLGYTDQTLLNALYQRANIFVFPTRSDVFPLVTLEAMAARTPVISTTVGGIPEQVTSDIGFLVPPRKPKAISTKVESLLQDEAKREEMGKAAFRRVQDEFSWDRVAMQTVTAYRNILD